MIYNVLITRLKIQIFPQIHAHPLSTSGKPFPFTCHHNIFHPSINNPIGYSNTTFKATNRVYCYVFYISCVAKIDALQI